MWCYPSLNIASMSCYFFLCIRLHPRSTLFPYTTLFRSVWRKQMRKTPSSMMAILAILMLILAACNGGGESPSASEAESRSEEHTSELQSQSNLVCRLLLEKKNLHVYSE